MSVFHVRLSFQVSSCHGATPPPDPPRARTLAHAPESESERQGVGESERGRTVEPTLTHTWASVSPHPLPRFASSPAVTVGHAPSRHPHRTRACTSRQPSARRRAAPSRDSDTAARPHEHDGKRAPFSASAGGRGDDLTREKRTATLYGVVRVSARARELRVETTLSAHCQVGARKGGELTIAGLCACACASLLGRHHQSCCARARACATRFCEHLMT